MNQFTLVTYEPRRFIAVILVICLLSAAGVVLAQDDTSTASAETDKPIVLKLDYKASACAAHLSLEYYQRGANAHVKSILTNEDCAASSGSYTLQVRFRDAKNEVHNVDYAETWARNDDAPIEFAKDYFAGTDVDVVRVRSRNLKCVCADVTTEDSHSGQPKN